MERRSTWLAWAAVAVVLAFLAGFGWQYYRASNFQQRLEETERTLAIERLRLQLAQAAIAAQSDDYEGARRTMSQFFTAAQAQLGEMPPEARRALQGMLGMRDDVITGLSRGNPDYAGVLYGMHERFGAALAASHGAEHPGAADTAPPSR